MVQKHGAKKPCAKKPCVKKPGAKKPGAKKPGAKKPGAVKQGRAHTRRIDSPVLRFLLLCVLCPPQCQPLGAGLGHRGNKCAP